VTLVLALLGGYVLVCLIVFLIQDRLLYFPSRSVTTDPGALGLAFEEVAPVTSDGVRLHGWYLPAPDTSRGSTRGPARGAVVFLHGNAGNVEHRIESARTFLEMGLDCLLVDYRGYGRSEGRPSEEGLYLDAEAAHDLARARGVPADRIVAYGESLGGAVAVELARRRPLAGLIVESSFRSLPELASGIYPWLPVRWLSRARFESEAKIANLDVPVLIVHSPADEIVPFEHGRTLFERAVAPKEFLETEAGHNDGGFQRRAIWRERVAEVVSAWLPGE